MGKLIKNSIILELIYIISISFIFCISAYFFINKNTIHLWSDYDSNLPVYQFFINHIKEFGRIPKWNPYVGAGIPVLGDLLSGVFNPLVFIPLYFLGIEKGLKVVIINSVILSGLSMWFLLYYYKISKNVRIFGSLIYCLSGALFSRISAGHIELIDAYIIIPIYFLFLFCDSNFKNTLVIALIEIYLLYSGAIYSILHTSIFYIVIQIYKMIIHDLSFKKFIENLLLLASVFSVLSLPKTIDFIYHSLPIFRREIIDNTLGSIHIIFFPFQFINPFGVSFYDRPVIQRVLNYHFNWYEYYVFIGFFPFYFLLYIKNILNNKYGLMTILLILTGALFISNRFTYSPFYWLNQNIEFLRNFRIPQRMFMPLTSLVIFLFCLILTNINIQYAKHKIIVITICVFSLICNGIVSWKILFESYEPTQNENHEIAKKLRLSDNSNYFVLNYVPKIQLYLIEQKIPIANYYYGWSNNNFPKFNYSKDFFNTKVFYNNRPKYIISSILGLNFTKFNYYKFIVSKSIIIWRTDQQTIIPNLHFY